MNPLDNLNDDPLLDLVCQLDEALESDDRDSIDQSSVSLTPEQRAEFCEAEKALEFIAKMRRNLQALQSINEDLNVESHPIADDSTVANLQATEFKKKVTSPNNSLPRSLGRFELIEVLGQGGFNRVFLARDPQLDRLIALKVPRPAAMMERSSRIRFQREATAAAILGHPSIVPIYEAGEIGPVSYIAFAYCKGKTLSSWFEQQDRNISAIETARIIAQLAEAVEHAHQRGVIHRDLKPANILLETLGEKPADSIAPQLRITDFGLAKFQASDGESLTIEGAIVGTPAYMSPEQAQGSIDVSSASDIFSLGTILYELLTGKLPFPGETHLATLRAIESVSPVAPHSLSSHVPKDLEAICLKCLAKEPKQRYSSAMALADDLQRWIEGRPILARPASKLEQLVAWRRRNAKLAATLAMFFTSVVVGLAATTWQWRQSLANFHESESQRARATTSIEIAQDTIDRMFNTIVEDVSAPRSLRNDLVSSAVELQEQLVANEPDNERIRFRTARAHLRHSQFLQRVGQEEQAIESAHRGIKLIDTISKTGPLGQEILPVLSSLTSLHALLTGKLQDTTAPITDNPNSTREILRDLTRRYSNSIVLMQQGKLDEAASEATELMDVLRSSHLSNNNRDVQYSRAATQLAQVQMKLGKLEEAERTMAVAAPMAIDVYQRITPRREELAVAAAKCMSLQAKLKLRIGDTDDARRLWQEAIDRFATELSYFPDSIHLKWGLLNASTGLAAAHADDGNHDAAIEILRSLTKNCESFTTHEVEDRYLGSMVAGAYGDLCVQLTAVEQFDAAEVAGRRADALIGGCKIDGPIRWIKEAQCKYRLARAILNSSKSDSSKSDSSKSDSGELDEAMAVAKAAMALAEKAKTARPADMGFDNEYRLTVRTLALCHCQRGDAAAALPLLGQHAEAFSRWPTSNFLSCTTAVLCIESLDEAEAPDEVTEPFFDHGFRTLRQGIETGGTDDPLERFESYPFFIQRDEYRKLRKLFESSDL